MTEPTGIAVFDFDDTLVEGDSLMPFLVEVVGARRAWWAMAAAVLESALRQVIGRPAGADLKGGIKALLLRRALTGVPVAETEAAARRLRRWLRWKPLVLEKLREHRRRGCRIVVASGALDLYLPVLLEGVPVDAVLATELEARDGRLTGRMVGGNCVRAEKARRVTAAIAWLAPLAPSWGYGNRPSDLPMLALVDHPTVV